MPFGDKSQYEYLAEPLCKEFPALQKQGSDPAQRGDVYFQFTGEPLAANWGWANLGGLAVGE